MWKTKVKLQDGEQLQRTRSATKGFMGEEDVNEYLIVNAKGETVGTVVHTDHTAVKGFRRTQTVRQVDSSGNVVTDERWTGA